MFVGVNGAFPVTVKSPEDLWLFIPAAASTISPSTNPAAVALLKTPASGFNARRMAKGASPEAASSLQ